MFVPSEVFQPSLMFARKAKAHLCEAPLRGCGRVAQLEGASLRQAPALLANIRLGWKSFPGSNTLASRAHSLVTKKI